MRRKIIIMYIIMLMIPISLQALEYEMKIEPAEYLQEDFLNRVQVRSGLRQGRALGLSDAEYQSDEHTELLLLFNSDPADEILRGEFAYQVVEKGVYVQNSQSYRGGASGMFLPGESLELNAEAGSMFAPGTIWGDFSMEFWIYPVELTSSEELFRWKGLSWLGDRPQIQEFTVRGEDGRLQWFFDHFFIKLSYNEEELPQLSYESVSLSSRREIVPRTWSHHILRYDSSRGLLEYLIDGRSEALAYLTDSGDEFADPFLPYIGDESDGRLQIGS